MRRIGLIGGMSWQSSALYYELINGLVAARLGGLHSADCVLASVDFAPLEDLMRAGDWDAIGSALAREAAQLQEAGAECLVLCTNTMHKVSERIVAATSVPLLDIVDVTATAVIGAGLSRVGLLGTRFTMQEPFYRERMARHGVELLVPDADGRGVVDEIIFRELVLGVVRDESRRAYQAIIAEMLADGAEGVILGCTEVELLLQPTDIPIPSFPSTALHAAAAVDFALA
jgi:aspartate racemase